MKRLECGFFPNTSTHTANEGYEILQVVVEFVPVKEEEEMTVSTKDAALIDSEGTVETAVGGGTSPNCCLGCVMESYLTQDNLITSFYFVTHEGKEGLKFQFMDYPQIALDK